MISQVEFDNKVIAFAQKEIPFAVKVADLRRQSDPLALSLEDRQILLNNVLMALRDYDIDSEVLEDSEIEYLFELATLATETCP